MLDAATEYLDGYCWNMLTISTGMHYPVFRTCGVDALAASFNATSVQS
jgi:hypothetical protein